MLMLPSPNYPHPRLKIPSKDSICHECGETRHWKRNCPQYLAELLKKKKNAASGAGGSEFLENSLINQETSESLKDLEIIQEEDTHPSIDTSLNHEKDNLEMDEPQSDIIPIRSSEVSCYTDAGYLTDADDLKFSYRICVRFKGGAVDLKSAKQSISLLHLQKQIIKLPLILLRKPKW
ncbi:zinc finger, CCHC-type containing protein [Tanacetum coccineum]